MRAGDLLADFGRGRKKDRFMPEDFGLRQTKVEVYVAGSELLEMQLDHPVGLFAVASTSAKDPKSAHSDAQNHRET